MGASKETFTKERPTPELLAVFRRFLDARVVERKTFGHPAAYAGGKMAFGTYGNAFLIRLPEGDYQEFTRRFRARPFRPMARGPKMSGWAVVPLASAKKPAMRGWITSEWTESARLLEKGEVVCCSLEVHSLGLVRLVRPMSPVGTPARGRARRQARARARRYGAQRGD